MKKRAKIITTIASLCLAVALMAFGVYAASSVSFGVTSKVNFTVTDVFVTVSGSAMLSTTAAPDTFSVVPSTQADTYTAGTDSNNYEKAVSFSGAKSYGGTVGTSATLKDFLTTDGTNRFYGWDAGTAKLTSANPGVQYTITIVNDSLEDDVYIATNGIATAANTGVNGSGEPAATITNEFATDEAPAQTGDIVAGTGDDAGKILFDDEQTLALPAGKTLTLTYTIVFNDYTRALSNASFLNNIKIAIGHTAAQATGALA